MSTLGAISASETVWSLWEANRVPRHGSYDERPIRRRQEKSGEGVRRWAVIWSRDWQSTLLSARPAEKPAWVQADRRVACANTAGSKARGTDAAAFENYRPV